jgi:DNA-binding MarR family transcriptional regulator
METVLAKNQDSASASNPNLPKAKKTSKRLDNYLRFGFLIHDVSRLRRIVVDRALKPLGVTRSQWWVLAFLSRRDGMTQTALAADLDLTKVAVGGLIDRMETSGVVERRPDQNDGRIKRVFLTKEGMSLVNKIKQHVDSVEEQIIIAVDDNELGRVAQTLSTIKHTLLDLIEGEDTDPVGKQSAAAK